MSSAFSSLQPGKTASSIERFFQWSLFILLVTGFAALMGTNSLDLLSLALVVPALLVRAWMILMRREWNLSERTTTSLTVLYFAFYAADYFYLSQSFIKATVHMVLFIMVVKIFSVRRDRDLLYLAILSFLMVLAAAVLTVDTLFLLTFSLFILVAIATFISMEMRRSERENLAVAVPLKEDLQFHRSLAGVAGTLGALTLAGSGLIFFVLPRINSGGYLRNFGVQGAMVTGFSQDVQLGGIGEIQQSSSVVMHVKVDYGKLPPDPKWRGVALANFDGRRWWNNPEAPSVHGTSKASLDLVQASPGAFYADPGSEPLLPTLRYRAVMEPTGVDLFFLAPVPLKLSGENGIVATYPDGSVRHARTTNMDESGSLIEEGQSIGAYYAEADTRGPGPRARESSSHNYPARVSLLYLQLPRVDPRIPALASQITQSASSNYGKAKAIEQYLHSNFAYTLELPGANQPDPLAFFLFQRKKGHCEYFASSMAVMLRTLGIPARIVNGFRGGEFNDITGSYIIREKDAHSWVEVYLPEYGWTSFDPTPPSTGGDSSLARISLFMDAARELWREWVINYDFSHQMRLSAELSTKTGNAQSDVRSWLYDRYQGLASSTRKWQERMAGLTTTDMVVICLVLAVLVALPFSAKAWRAVERKRSMRNPARAPRTAASFWYLRMLKLMARRGAAKSPSQTPTEFASSIDDPAARRQVDTFTVHYEKARFDGSPEDAERLPELYEEMSGRK